MQVGSLGSGLSAAMNSVQLTDQHVAYLRNWLTSLCLGSPRETKHEPVPGITHGEERREIKTEPYLFLLSFFL